MTTWISGLARTVRTGWGDVDADERGDIPGWVLVTLMTAAIVVGIWLIAQPALEGVFDDAINRLNQIG